MDNKSKVNIEFINGKFVGIDCEATEFELVQSIGILFSHLKKNNMKKILGFLTTLSKSDDPQADMERCLSNDPEKNPTRSNFEKTVCEKLDKLQDEVNKANTPKEAADIIQNGIIEVLKEVTGIDYNEIVKDLPKDLEEKRKVLTERVDEHIKNLMQEQKQENKCNDCESCSHKNECEAFNSIDDEKLKEKLLADEPFVEVAFNDDNEIIAFKANISKPAATNLIFLLLAEMSNTEIKNFASAISDLAENYPDPRQELLEHCGFTANLKPDKKYK